MAASTPFTGCSPSRLVNAQNANTISTKYSAGPKASAQLAKSGASTMMPRVAISEPTNEDQADSDNATLARPWRARG